MSSDRAYDCLAGSILRLYAANQRLSDRLERLEKTAAPRRRAERKPKPEIAKTLDVPRETVRNVLTRVGQNGGTVEMAKPEPAPAPETPVRLARDDHPLRVWRRAHGVSLERVAEWSATTRATISRIETGRQQPRRELLVKLAELTGSSVGDFLAWLAAPARSEP